MLTRTFFSLAGATALCSLPLTAQGFVNRTLDVGLDHELATGFDTLEPSTLRNFLQRGVALGDIDGDGDVDAVCAGGILPNSVMRWDGAGFTDITAQAGIEVGDFDASPCLADFDGDGDLDLFIGVVEGGGFGQGVGAEPASRFYRNDGTGTFEEITTLAWTRGSGHTIFAQWADMDNDGLVDLIAAEFFTTANHYYRNNGDGTFSDRSVIDGLDTPGSTHATCVIDADDDGILDMFVGNDYIVSFWGSLPGNEGDQHYQGQSDGTWASVTDGSGYDHPRGIMGMAVGDVDYDGDYDVYKTDVDSNRLTINQGWPGTGQPWLGEEQYAYGIECDFMPWPPHPSGEGKLVAWGATFQDFNFDLWLDLLVINGQVSGFNTSQQFCPRDQPNFLYTGAGPGAGFAFDDSSAALGITETIDDRCVAVADFDEDGDLDFIVAPGTGKLRYFENQIDPAGQGWLMVRPRTTTSALGAFGVEVKFTDSLGYPHIRQIGLDGTTASQHDNFAYFGLGTEASVDLTIEYPSGLVMSLPGITPNQVLTPVEPLLFEVSARTMPIGPNPRKIGNRTQPGGAGGPAGLYAVTAYAHDQAGNPLDHTAAVTIEVPGLTPATAVLNLGGNMFRRYFTAPFTPGDYRAEITFDGWAVRTRPRIHFYDPTDTSGTTAQVLPEAVRAGSADTFQVIVAPKDANGISLGNGDVVDIQISGLSPLSGPTDLGDGRYSASFPAPSVSGFHPITVTVNGGTVPLGLQIEAGGAPQNAQSDILQEKPQILQSIAPWQFRLLVTPKDANGARLGPYTDVQIVPVASGGTPPVTVRTDLYPDGQPDGSHAFIVEKPYTDPPTDVTGTYQLWIDGVHKANLVYIW